MSPTAALALLRLAQDAAALLLWGACAYVAALVPPGLGRDLSTRLRRFRHMAIVVAAASTAAMLPATVAAVADGWGDVGDGAIVRAVLFDTGVGRAWLVAAVAAALLGATLLPAPPRGMAGTAGAAGLLLASLALTGHAAMDDGLRGWVHRLNDGVHLLAGGAWLGALVPLALLLGDTGRHPEAGLAMRRFSSAGHLAVALVLATGALNTALVLGRWPTDMTSPYQGLLALKIALVGVMVALALANRYVLVPRMTTDPVRAARLLRRGTIAEIVLGLAVVACVAVFGLLAPV